MEWKNGMMLNGIYRFPHSLRLAPVRYEKIEVGVSINGGTQKWLVRGQIPSRSGSMMTGTTPPSISVVPVFSPQGAGPATQRTTIPGGTRCRGQAASRAAVFAARRRTAQWDNPQLERKTHENYP